MKVLVTGGAGYIGSSLVEELNDLPHISSIIVFDNLSRSPLAFFIGRKKLQKVKFIKGDILDGYALDQVVSGVDVVYHLAGYVMSPFSYAQNILYEQINQWGTLNLVRCIQNNGRQLKKFIYLSSTAVFGLRGLVDESLEPEPTNAYGNSKLTGEKFAALLNEICPVSIIRSANVFGFNPSFRLDSVLNNFIFHGVVDNKILIYGNGLQSRPFISLNELITHLLAEAAQEIPHRRTPVCLMQFNANMGEIKDWLLQNHLPDLEYTYVNRNLNYEGQLWGNLPAVTTMYPSLDQVFADFKNNLKVTLLETDGTISLK